MARAFLVRPRRWRSGSRGQETDPRSADPVPGADADELPQWLPGVLQVLYAIFTEGYAASTGPRLQRLDVAEEAIRLTRVLHRLLPGEREIAGSSH
ncbi:hypothetical protein GS461_14940 [Rhodococcus hoagii]|nr:hypothetical protein [Prescottella equi]